MFFFPKGQNATSKDVQDFVECHLFCALQSIVGKEDQWTVGANVVVFGKKVLQMSYPCWNWHFRTCWNTIVSFWGPAYFQGLLLLVSGRVFQPTHQLFSNEVYWTILDSLDIYKHHRISNGILCGFRHYLRTMFQGDFAFSASVFFPNPSLTWLESGRYSILFAQPALCGYSLPRKTRTAEELKDCPNNRKGRWVL